jgi:SprT protein
MENNIIEEIAALRQEIRELRYLIKPPHLSKREYAVRTFEEQMQKYGLFDLGWNYTFNRRPKGSGVTKYKSKVIEISTKFLDSEKITEYDIRRTIAHEIAHAILGPGKGHGHEWRKKFKELGYDGKKTSRKFT